MNITHFPPRVGLFGIGLEAAFLQAQALLGLGQKAKARALLADSSAATRTTRLQPIYRIGDL